MKSAGVLIDGLRRHALRSLCGCGRFFKISLIGRFVKSKKAFFLIRLRKFDFFGIRDTME